MQPPPPTPVPTQGNTVTCQWCSQPMNTDAVRCNSCGKLRKDIYTEKVWCYVLCIVGGLLIGISIALWKSKPNQFEDYYNTSSADNTTSYVLLVIGILAALAGIYYYVRVSQKLKTWVWM